jgi:hypothetical protein
VRPPVNHQQLQRSLVLTATFAAAAAGAQPWQPVAAPQLAAPLHLDARLRVDAEPEVAARVWLGHRGEICLRVTAPRAQRIWSAQGASAVYDVGAGTVLRFGAGKGASPLFEALLVGLARSPVPPGAQLDERKVLADPAGALIETTWSVHDAAGRDAGHLRVVEGRDGPRRIELRDADDRALRRYRLGARRALATVTAPSAIDVEVLGRQGQIVRREAWRLQPFAAPAPDLTSEKRCLDSAPNVRETRL